MIPYYEIKQYLVTPHYIINVPGLLFALSILIGFLFCLWRAHELEVPKRRVLDLLLFVLAPAVIGSRVLGLLFYDPGIFFSEGSIDAVLNYRGGSASMAGVVSGVAAFWIFTWAARIRGSERLLLADIALQTGVVGLIFGRLLCFLVHDHLGEKTEFFLAVNFPGGARHDLGLYELLYLLIVLFPVSQRIHRLGLKPGTQTATCFLGYGVGRFLLDFLRVGDTRYFGLTPAQYICAAFVVWGLLLFRSIHSKPRSTDSKDSLP